VWIRNVLVLVAQSLRKGAHLWVTCWVCQPCQGSTFTVFTSWRFCCCCIRIAAFTLNCSTVGFSFPPPRWCCLLKYLQLGLDWRLHLASSGRNHGSAVGLAHRMIALDKMENSTIKIAVKLSDESLCTCDFQSSHRLMANQHALLLLWF